VSPAYPHLLLNHLPVVVALVASVLLAVAVWRGTVTAAIYGYGAQMAVGVLAILAYVSGNFAPPALDHVAGGVPVDRITFHQITAASAMIVSVLVALAAFVPIYMTSIAARRGIVIAFLVLSVGLDALFAFTATTGGAIRHTELSH
jgi:type IV secretory pathway TrbL component